MALACVGPKPPEASIDTASAVGTDTGPAPGSLDADGDGITDDVDCDDSDSGAGAPVPRWVDADGDGYGDVDAPLEPACTVGAGEALRHGDCDDGDATIHPDANEVCDGIDNDCDRRIDDADDSISGMTETIYVDADGDGYGDPAEATPACGLRSGFSDNALDCDDRRPSINPGMDEVCASTFDEDCDGAFGEACGVYALLPEPESPDTGSADSGLGDTGTAEADPVTVLLPQSDLVEIFAEHSGATGHTAGEAFDLNGDGYEDAVASNPFFATPVEGAGTLNVLWGSVSWPDGSTAEAAIRSAEDRTGLGTSLTRLSDFNGNGQPELVALDAQGLWLMEPGAGVQGTAVLIDDVATWGLSNEAEALLPKWVESAGDVNGDGLTDLMVARGRSEVVVLFGSSAPLSGTIDDHVAVRVWSETDVYDTGRAGSFAGSDIDGDGFSDLLIADPDLGFISEGYVMMFAGAGLSSGVEVTFENADLSLTNDTDAWGRDSLGQATTGIGDFNHDGYEDFAIGRIYSTHPVAIFSGEATWFSPDREWVRTNGLPSTDDAALLVDLSSIGSSLHAASVSAAPDLTGDGYPDLLIDLNTEPESTVVLAGGEGWDSISEVPRVGWITYMWGDRSNSMAVDFTGTRSPYFTLPRTNFLRAAAPFSVAPIPGL